jgi:hypothetical protein
MGEIHEKEPATEDIERRAYGFYLLRGMADGKAFEDWIRAEKELWEEFARSNRQRSTTRDRSAKVARGE